MLHSLWSLPYTGPSHRQHGDADAVHPSGCGKPARAMACDHGTLPTNGAPRAHSDGFRLLLVVDPRLEAGPPRTIVLSGAAHYAPQQVCVPARTADEPWRWQELPHKPVSWRTSPHGCMGIVCCVVHTTTLATAGVAGWRPHDQQRTSISSFQRVVKRGDTMAFRICHRRE